MAGYLQADTVAVPKVAVEPRSAEERLANRLFRHYAPGVARKNVWRLTDGTYTYDQPTDATLIDKVFAGGHVNYVTDDEQAALEAAGFTVSGSASPATFEGGLQVRGAMPITTGDLDLMLLHGAKWVRLDLDMAFVVPDATTSDPLGGLNLNVGNRGTLISYAKQIGLKVLAAVSYSPSGLASYHEIPQTEATRTAYATAVARVVEEYHELVDVWELWNEINHGPFNEAPRMATIRPFMRALILAMREVDPDAVILPGGPSPATSCEAEWTARWDEGSTATTSEDGTQQSISIGTYLAGLYDDDEGIVPGNTPGTPYVDGLTTHAYGGEYSPLLDAFENPMLHCFTDISDIGETPFNFYDDILVANEGADTTKRIWNTESGWFGGFTGGSGHSALSEATAGLLAIIMLAHWRTQQYAGKAGPCILFELYDQEVYGESDDFDNYLGMFRLTAEGTYEPKAQLGVVDAFFLA